MTSYGRSVGLLCFFFGAAMFGASCSTSNSATPDEAGTGADGDTDAGPAPIPCTTPAECPSHICLNNFCAAPSPTDGTKNGDETDVDCGGKSAPGCDILKACLVGPDCATGVCADTGDGLKCQPPSSTDGVKNGTETDVDCGGFGNPLCANGLNCASHSDCLQDICVGGKCQAPTPANGIQDGTETDVDCGGPTATRCTDNLKCGGDSDCQSDVCKDVGLGLRCQPPSPTDMKKNGTETDVDCGGNAAPACNTGQNCLAGTDCTSKGCDYNKKCAAGRSCTAHYGGDTCGTGGEGGVGAANWETCCARAPVTTAQTGTVYLDRYKTTAGRMRVFMESINYNVRSFVQSARTDGKIPTNPTDTAHSVLEPVWDMYLPTSFAGDFADPAEISDCFQGDVQGGACKPGTAFTGIYSAARFHIGGTIFRANSQSSTGCYVSAGGTHAYRFSDADQAGLGDIPSEQPQTVYDARAMQCIPYLVAQAFCIWDGGRLETMQEWLAAWGPGALPWGAAPTPKAQVSNTYNGCRYPTATDASLRGANPGGCAPALIPAAGQSIEQVNYKYSYEYPNLIDKDYIVFLPYPGRTIGRGPGTHADVIGGLFEITSNVVYKADPHIATHQWSGNGSFEVHDYTKGVGSTTMILDKYGKLGLRCVYTTPNP